MLRAKNTIFIFCMLAVVLLLPAVLAQSNESILKQEVKMQIQGDDVLIASLMRFPKNLSANISVDIPDDAENVTVRLDNHTLNTTGSSSIILLINSTKYAKISYKRTEMVESSTFIGSITAPAETEALRVKLTLPEKAVLTKPMDQAWGPSKSVLPKPKRLETDGTKVTIVWEFTDVKKAQDIAFYVKYSTPKSYALPAAAAVIASFIILLPLAYLLFRRKAPAASKKSRQQKQDIKTHLKESEQQIVNILRLKKGRCEQGTLRVATGFSKAKVSGLLRELEARNIIHKEKRGNKNLVFLKA